MTTLNCNHIKYDPKCDVCCCYLMVLARKNRKGNYSLDNFI